MKYFKLFSIFISVLFVTQITAQTTKHALIIAAGNYPKANGWSTISSIRDVGFINSTLLKQGFKQDNIKKLQDAQVTPTGINTAFEELKKRVKPGDVVVIHVSSHGVQIADDNGDEADGLDETIVTYNAVSPNENLAARGGKLSKGKIVVSKEQFEKNQKEYFRDERFGAAVNQLRLQLGKEGDVLVFMDLCHSGTGMRGNAVAKVRGGQPALVPIGFDSKQQVSKETSDNADNVIEDESKLASYVVISAARAEELDYETEYKGEAMGSLSYAVSKVFQTLNPATTYRSLFAKIQSVMHEKVPQQHPVLEGSVKGIDRRLFGGQFEDQKPFLEITQLNDKEVTVNGGLFSGLDKGAKVALYPNTTLDPAKETPITTGTVTKAGNYTAEVLLAKSSGLKQPADGRIFVTVPAFKVDPISIKIISDKSRSSVQSFSDAEVQNIKMGLKDVNVSFDGTPELLIVKGSDKDSIKVAGNGYLFTEVPTQKTKDFRQAIQQYAQYKFLQTFSANDKNVHFEVKLVPEVNGVPDTTLISSQIKNGTYEFTEGDLIFLKIKNTSKIPIYVNILDLQPDGIINPVIPNTALKFPIYPSDLKIKAGETRLFDKYPIELAPPYGTELFKIFASTQELDLEGIATTRSVRGGNLGELEKIVKNSYQVGIRGAKIDNIKNTDGTTADLLFEIKPKNK